MDSRQMIDRPPTVASNLEEHGSLNENDLKRLLDVLLAYKMDFTQGFLKERGLPFSGNREQLRERLVRYLADGNFQVSELVQLLNAIEGWGYQHIYLYKAPEHLTNEWSDGSVVRQRLQDAGMLELFNRPRPLLMPESPTLAEIQWSPQRLRFVWVEARRWEERASDIEDKIEENQNNGRDKVIWRAYRAKVSRGVVAFEWNLVTGSAMLMIHRLPSGTSYRKSNDQFTAELEPILGIRHFASTFEPVEVGWAIQPLDESGSVRRRHLAYALTSGSKAEFTSADSTVDVFADDALEEAADSLPTDKAGIGANFYWPAGGGLSREVHFRIYGEEHRLAIFGQHTEQDVRYVLSHILAYCE